MTTDRAALCLFVLLMPAAPASADAWDWLIQKVCVDSSDQPQPVDPYYGCPSGMRLRALRPGDNLPYHKYDSGYGNIQRHDSYPVARHDGTVFVLNPFAFGNSATDPALETFKPGGDGYDIFEVRDGWASGGQTKDGGGFSTTFFGSGCLPYNGWIFFPSDVTASSIGSAAPAISGRYWEQNGENWPGACPSGYANDHVDWYPASGWAFGNAGSTIKTMDAMIVVHGYNSSSQFLSNGHLEVFYFTQQYGVTRWEVWKPAAQTPTQTTSVCNGAKTYNRYGIDFVVTDCRDWSNVTLLSTPAPPAVWPVPDLNLLSNFHFGNGVDSWGRWGNSAEGNIINWSLLNSTLALDSKYSQTGAGVRYLAINCAGTCTNRQIIYQDVPISARTPSGHYTVAVTARTEGGQGTLELALSQIDGSGNYITHDTHSASVLSSYPAWTADPSVMLHSGFLSATVKVQISPSAAYLRFALMPQTANTFDILEAWLMHTPYAPITSTYADIGLRLHDGTSAVAIAAEPLGTLKSSLRVVSPRDGKVYGVALVEPSDAKASKLKVTTPQGAVKALRKFN